ncbi:MAG: DUF2461 domain-containing protein [Geodermatophilaceae bacterium]
MKFTGFPDSAIVFYEGLEADNSKTYWTKNRQIYDDDVRAPMLAMLAELEPEFGPASVYRPYRDVRFSKDKTPYKTAVAAGAGGYYVQLSADGLMVAGGYYDTASDQVERLRRAVDDDVQGAALERIVATLRRGGWDIGGHRLKTRPRGYDADHPRIELLKHRTLIAHRHWEPAPWLHTARAKQRVQKAWRDLAALDVWLATNVGSSAQQR